MSSGLEQAGVPAAASRGGRPSREAAQQLGERILDAATELMLENGYGATSIEAVAARAGVSKRTFYHRFADKSVLVQAVVARIVDAARPAARAPEGHAGDLAGALLEFGNRTLQAALAPQVLALYRLIVGESHRFPDLLTAAALTGGRTRTVQMLAGLLRKELPGLDADDAEFAANQFLQLLVSLPQLRALGIGDPMPPGDCERWVGRSVSLLLDGLRARASGQPG